MEEILAFFRSLALFQGLTGEQLRSLAAHAQRRDFAPGQTIIQPEQTVRAFYLLATGRAKLSALLPDGKEQTIYVFSPGEPFCLCWAFDRDRFPASVSALEDSTVYVISQADLEQEARVSPGLLFNIILLLSHRLKEAMERIQSLSIRNADQRLALFLLGLGAQSPERVHLPISHRELAKLLGLTPEALSRTFRRLGEGGLVALDNRDIAVLDRAGLEALAQSEGSA